MTKLTTVNWGIIGCGDVTEVKSGPPLYKLPHSDLVAVMRRNGEKAADYARRHGVPRWYTDAQQLIDDPEVNAVYIATPPNTHAGYAIAAMQAGKLAYIEKPMARSFQECLQIIQVAEQTDLPVYVAYYRRALPNFLKVKELVERGAIGQPLLVNIRLFKAAAEKDQSPEEQHWHVNPEIGGGGHFFDLACHQLDFLDFLFGPIAKVSGHTSNQAGYYPAEDTVIAQFEFESGLPGSGVWCFVAHPRQEEDVIEILGTEGAIRLPCFGDLVVELQSGKQKELFSFDKPEHIAGGLISQVVDAYRGVGTCPSTMESAVRTNWVMDRIVKDFYDREI